MFHFPVQQVDMKDEEIQAGPFLTFPVFSCVVINFPFVSCLFLSCSVLSLLSFPLLVSYSPLLSGED